MTSRGRLTALGRSVREWSGIARSVRIYYGSPSRLGRMRQLYGTFVKPGDLVFDIGAHVGDRIAAFRRLGCRVVAVEPQPAAFRFLQLAYGRSRAVTLLHAAAGERSGVLTLRLNTSNPTVSTASESFIAAAKGSIGWEGQDWAETIEVPAITLDDLIAAHGAPVFAKIDVEGFELHVLKGLSRPLAALSFEFTTIQRELAADCIARLSKLGAYRFNMALGESQSLIFTEPVGAQAMTEYIAALPHAANSGDVYALLQR